MGRQVPRVNPSGRHSDPGLSVEPPVKGLCPPGSRYPLVHTSLVRLRGRDPPALGTQKGKSRLGWGAGDITCHRGPLPVSHPGPIHDRGQAPHLHRRDL